MERRCVAPSTATQLQHAPVARVVSQQRQPAFEPGVVGRVAQGWLRDRQVRCHERKTSAIGRHFGLGGGGLAVAATGFGIPVAVAAESPAMVAVVGSAAIVAAGIYNIVRGAAGGRALTGSQMFISLSTPEILTQIPSSVSSAPTVAWLATNEMVITSSR